jgi:hypothetical protein
MMIENTATFLDEANDPEQLDFELDSIIDFLKQSYSRLAIKVCHLSRPLS